MSVQEILLLNTLIFVKELALHASHGQMRPDKALVQIVQEIEKTHAIFMDATQQRFDQTLADSFDALNNGNRVELRPVGKHKWLFVNGVHIAGVVSTSLRHGSNAITTFTAEFAVTKFKGFDNE